MEVEKKEKDPKTGKEIKTMASLSVKP